MSLSHIVGIITGGASGLGAATATTLIREGARIVVADLPHQYQRYLDLAEDLCQTSESYPSMQGRDRVISFVETDVTNEDQVNMALNTVEELYGEPGTVQYQESGRESCHRVHLRTTHFVSICSSPYHSPLDTPLSLSLSTTVNAAINCAGIGIAKKTLSKSRESGGHPCLVPHSLEEFTRAITINTIGSFNVARLAAERMATRDADLDGLRGCIIHTASIAAMDGQRGQVAYATSKAALVGMTLPMARDLSTFGIRVMTIVRTYIHILPSNQQPTLYTVNIDTLNHL